MNASWTAGVAAADITPPIGLDLSGYAAREQGSVGTHDSLFAKVLVLSDGAEKSALVTCDLLGVEAREVERIRRTIERETGIRAENILVAASHTHSGPATLHGNGIGARDKGWLDRLVEMIAGCVLDAGASMEPATLEFSAGDAFIGINRRGKIPPGSINPAPDPGGPVDRRLSVLTVKRAQGDAVRAVLFVHGCHATVLGAENRLISADYPGFAIKVVEDALGSQVMAMFANGGAGDVNPVEMGSYAAAERLGESLGRQVVDLVGKRGEELEPNLRVTREDAELPFASSPTTSEAQALVNRYALAMESSAPGSVERKIAQACLLWSKKLARAVDEGARPNKLTVEVQRITLSDLQLIGLPLEPFSETAMAIRGSLGDRTVVIGYANGNVGYLPTRKEIPKGGYEVLEAHKYYDMPSHFAPEAEENIRKAAAGRQPSSEQRVQSF